MEFWLNIFSFNYQSRRTKIDLFVFMSACVVKRADINKPVAASCCRTFQLALAECWPWVRVRAGEKAFYFSDSQLSLK
jgi:hypothetical protein